MSFTDPQELRLVLAKVRVDQAILLARAGASHETIRDTLAVVRQRHVQLVAQITHLRGIAVGA